MTDQRWAQLADHIATRLEVTADSRVSIFVNDAAALPGAHALIQAVTRRGAAVQTVYTSEFAEADALAAYDLDQLAAPAPVERAAMEWSTVHVSLRAMLWPEADTSSIVDLPQRLAALRTAKGVVSTLRWQGTRWAVVRVPTPDWAARINVPAETLLNEFFAGALDDWDANRERWQPVADALTNGAEVTITSADTDLTLGIAGRRGVLFAGDANLPDGEVATAPIDNQVDGHITFAGTAIFAGQVFEDLRLDFAAGQVVDVRATRGAEVARALIDTDEGSHRVGELGIGVSSAVRQWTGDLFIDEKILGTVHLALGRAYPECGGVNQSSLHWDIVKDLRSGAPGGGGTLAIDGTPVVDRGHVVWPGLS
ncbi:aminopeptidase [Amycolatopsis silviterrae]|uniref:Aminopeptidase n=1 Tax=Amycolatopsis silviterrae TaxID=1656914 RepID=A0ABW5HE96_9PSEU